MGRRNMGIWAVALVVVVVVMSMQIDAGNVYINRFLVQYQKIHNASNGYFSKEGVPYHAVETLMVEAPDYGHVTTSEAVSYYIWLEAMYGAVAKNFAPFNRAWQIMEEFLIPVHDSQSTNSAYNPSHPATYAAEWDDPSQYPSQIESGVPVGQDPIYQELVSAYGTPDIYAMHWLSDLDNVYGFGNTQGNCEGGPSVSGPSFINTFQRGAQESVWKTIPQPCCDSFKYGGPNGFLDLYTKDNGYAKQWKYTAAPDADARAIQAAFWANRWAQEVGKAAAVADTLAKAAKLGDYLRYSLFDKYFKRIGDCVSPWSCPGGYGKESAHYLIGWYFAWGGSLDTSNPWAWRIGDGSAHFGYQNPLTAWALVNEPGLKPRGASAATDWQNSYDRQLELYEWLQTAEGAFAGGVSNSWNGRYDAPPADLTANTFHGMFYDWEPVYHDPPSNRWFGMQPWSVDRLAQLYYVTGEARVKSLLDKWVRWVLSEITFQGDAYSIPATLDWSGNPPNVHVTVTGHTNDVGTASALARTLTFYAAKSGDQNAKAVAKKLLDGMWKLYQTNKGVSNSEVADTYNQFGHEVYVPPNWYGTYPNGDVIQAPATFIGIRSWYKKDPAWPQVEAYMNGGAAPVFTFHRFWAQADIALSQGTYGMLFDD